MSCEYDNNFELHQKHLRTANPFIPIIPLLTVIPSSNELNRQ